MSEYYLDPDLEELTDRAAGRLLKADIFDAHAFDALTDRLWQKKSKDFRAKPQAGSPRSAIRRWCDT